MRGFLSRDAERSADTSPAHAAASCQVHLYISLWDTGTGAPTIMRQPVAETLTLPTPQVHLVMQDTDYSSRRRYKSRHRVSCFSQVGGPDDSGLRPGWGVSRRCWLAAVVAASAS